MMSQLQRNNALESYKSRRVSILIATDVAGRGLDIPRYVCCCIYRQYVRVCTRCMYSIRMYGVYVYDVSI